MADLQKKLANALMQYAPDSNKLQDFLSNLQLSGNIGSSSGQGSDTLYGQGRVGYNFPMGEGNLNAGIGLGGYKTDINVPGYKNTLSDFGVNRLDATYQKGANTFGGNVSMNPQGNDYYMYYKRDF
jgi:hypothetical protein